MAQIPRGALRTGQPHRLARSAEAALRYGLLAAFGALFLLPFYIIVRNALLTQPEITAFEWVWLPSPPHWENLGALFNDPTAPMLTGLGNSLLIAVCQTAGQLLICSLAGYGLARIPFRWRDQVFYLILITLMIPSAVTFVPTYVVVANLGWVNTPQGIIVPGLFSAFSTFLLRQFYLDFPADLEDAGRVDGLGDAGIYWHLALPNSRAILASLGVICFINSWNAFLWPLVIGQTPASWTVQIVLSTFITAQTINLPALFMGAAVAIAPLLVVFGVLQRFIVEGVKASGIKG